MPGEELLPRGLAASFGRQINAMSFEDIRDRAALTGYFAVLNFSLSGRNVRQTGKAWVRIA
jgi:hypothetical protein